MSDSEVVEVLVDEIKPKLKELEKSFRELKANTNIFYKAGKGFVIKINIITSSYAKNYYISSRKYEKEFSSIKKDLLKFYIK